MPLDSITTPLLDFSNLSWNPDVPAHMLKPNEYNQGGNVEVDVRTIRKIYGEEELLALIPGTPIYVIGVNRTPDTWNFIVATREGRYYLLDQTTVKNITPGVGVNPNVFLTGYSDNTNITDAEVGGVVFINDALRPPMFFRPQDTEIQIYDTAPGFVWNYESGIGITSVVASFVRSYNSAHGNVLVAGGLVKTTATQVINQQATLRWSNIFAQGGVPTTWAPTNFTFGNEVDAPVRGPLVDGYQFQGNFYVASYWDTAGLFPISYQSTFDPIFATRQVNTGRGLLNNNTWTNTDALVYGMDARDIWTFDGQEFKSLGNQRVKEYLYANLSPLFSPRAFLTNNTRKNQIELYYPSPASTSWCDQMISYRYDLDAWQPPRTVANACLAIEGPVLVGNIWQESQRTVWYARGGNEATGKSRLIRKDVPNTYTFIDPVKGGVLPIVAFFERNDIILPEQEFWRRSLFHRVYPQMQGTGSVTISIAGAQNVGQVPDYSSTFVYTINTNNPWLQGRQNDFRTISFRITSNDTQYSWHIGAMLIQAVVQEQDY